VARTDYPNLDVYLIDNGSIDGSTDYVKVSFPWVKLILNRENLGFAEGYNRGIEKANSDYIVLLNNDTEVLNPNWVKKLIDKAVNDPKVAAIACKMVSMKDHSHLDSVGGMGIPFWRGFIDIGRGEKDKGQYDRGDFEPFSFCGGAALIRRDIFMKLGGFDGKFFIYFEDVDFSWRLRLHGYRVAFESKAKVAHYFSASIKNVCAETRKMYLCHRNLLNTILKNCGSSIGWALRNFSLFSLLITAGFIILEPTKAIAVVKAIFWNLFNLKDTYIRRKRIQAERSVDETEILRVMYPRLKRYRPTRFIKLQRILDTLFEYSRAR
jgi:GT2 family glycosyltransferase